MTVRRKMILMGLDSLSILLGLIEISVITLIFKYDSNTNMKTLFGFMGVICFILIYNSIKAIKNKQA